MRVIVLDLKFPQLQPKTDIFEKHDNSFTLKASDLAILHFEI